MKFDKLNYFGRSIHRHLVCDTQLVVPSFCVVVVAVAILTGQCLFPRKPVITSSKLED